MRKTEQPPTVENPSDLGRVGETTVEYPHDPGDALRLVTLSWSVLRRGGDLLDPEDFLTTLRQLRVGYGGSWDMLFAS